MKKLLTPTWTINSIYAIKPGDLLRHNIKAIICDLDNTLIAWNQWEHTEEMAEWLTRFKDAGIGIYLLSNNNYDRVLKVAEPLELRFTSSALKPRRKHFVLAIEDLQVPKENVAVIGDQVMTDVIGANRNHLKSILVKPIAPNDNIYTIINRMLEKLAFKIVGIDRTGDWGIRLSEQETFQCIGCGATIQTENPDEIGYLPQSALNKGIEKGEFYCQRCFKLRHYNQLQDLDIDDDVFLNKLGEIANDDAFVVLVVDIFDVEGSLISGLHRFIGNQPFIIAANKFDLLPKVTRKSKVKDWIRQTVNRHGLYPEDIVLTYGTKRAGIYSLAEKIEEVISDRNVYIVGVTNVGKSTLINQLIGYYGGDKEVITTSNHPGTTLDLIQIPLTDAHAIIDTPGIIRRTQLAHHLSRSDNQKVLPSKPIKPKTFQLNEGQTIFLAGVGRVDLVQSEVEKTAMTFYVSTDLYLHRTKTENADELYQKHVGEMLSPPSKDYVDEYPELVEQTFTLDQTQDISITGLGWLTVNAKVEIKVWLPKEISVSKRTAII